MDRFIDPCCSKCSHNPKAPCKQFVDCCLDGPKCHDDEDCAQKRQAIIDRLAHSPGYRQTR